MKYKEFIEHSIFTKLDNALEEAHGSNKRKLSKIKRKILQISFVKLNNEILNTWQTIVEKNSNSSLSDLDKLINNYTDNIDHYNRELKELNELNKLKGEILLLNKHMTTFTYILNLPIILSALLISKFSFYQIYKYGRWIDESLFTISQIIIFFISTIVLFNHIFKIGKTIKVSSNNNLFLILSQQLSSKRRAFYLEQLLNKLISKK